MPDYRLPLSNARQKGLLPDLAPIRADMRYAAINLFGELFEFNPRMPLKDDPEASEWPLPACPDSELNETQRALFGVYQMIDVTPPWQSWLLPRMLWAARLIGIGQPREGVEQAMRMGGNDPDALVAAYAEDPDRPASSYPKWRSRWCRDPYRKAASNWWTSIDHPEYLEFNRSVFEFALKRLPDLIALEEED